MRWLDLRRLAIDQAGDEPRTRWPASHAKVAMAEGEEETRPRRCLAQDGQAVGR